MVFVLWLNYIFNEMKYVPQPLNPTPTVKVWLLLLVS